VVALASRASSESAAADAVDSLDSALRQSTNSPQTEQRRC
jgi:hypothetical protein